MSKKNQIQLEFTSILNVPFQSYTKDFTFIVNGEKYQTTRLISDLLSPQISQIHSVDPTFDTFTINTKNKGNFSHILSLIDFQLNDLSDNDLPFIIEVLEQLNNNKIKLYEEEKVELTEANVINELQKHELHPKYYSIQIETEIEYITSHMDKLLKTQEEELMKLQIDTLERIISSEQLTISTEDDLVEFINKLYKHDSKYCIFYEYVYFINISTEKMKEFIETFDMNDLSNGTWHRLCDRLEKEIAVKNFERKRENKTNNNENEINKNEFPQGKTFSSENGPFSGIFNYLRSQGDIDDLIEVTASSILNSGINYQPITVCLKENSNAYFITYNSQGSWIEIDFKNHKVIPSDYTLRSSDSRANWNHPKSWVFEVSNDENDWSIIDEVNDCPYLNGFRQVHTFKIKNEQIEAFRYVRIRLTAENWHNCDYLSFETIELFGTLI